jgi:hypothetical protein
VFLLGGRGVSGARGDGMIRKPTWITLAVFLLLVVVAILWPRLRPDETDLESTPTLEPPWIVPFSEIVGIKVENFEKEKSVELQRDAEGLWMQIAPSEGQADVELIEQTINWLASPAVTRELPIQGGLAQFGLDEAKGIITVTSSDGTTSTLLIGDVTVTGSMRYVIMPHGSKVLLINKYDVNSVLDLVDGNWLITPLPEEIEPEGTETAVP